MKVSTCVITKNESDNIRRCLGSLTKVADEIIVVDTGSTDDTVKIAKEHGARVFQYKWDNNFANAKNYALDQVNGDWIIFLDADEYLDSNTEAILREVLNQIHPKIKYDTVQCRMIHTDGYKGKVISENPAIRIFRSNRLIRFDGAIHEKPLKNNKPLKSVFLNNLELLIYHTGYELSILQEKFKRNLSLLEEQEKNNDIDHMTYYYLSASNSNLGNNELAIKYAMLALKEPKLAETTVAFKPYVFLIKGMLGLKDKIPLEDIEKYIIKALELFPSHPEIWRLKGLYKQEQKQYLSAINSYKKALEYHHSFNKKMLNDFPIYIEEVYCELASLNYFIGDSPNVLENYYRALHINKYSKKAFKGLIDIIKNQNVEEILFFLNNIYHKNDERDLVFLVSNLDELNNYAAMYYKSLLYTKLANQDLS